MAIVLAVLVLMAGVVWRQAAPGASARPADTVRTPPAAVPVPASAPPIAPPARDIFIYAGVDDDDQPALSSAPRAPAATPLPAPPSLAETAPAAPEGPRLVGIVRQAGALRAVVSVDGETLVLRAGDRAGAYTVLAIDEDEGVQLRDPAGTTITLSPMR
jgi:hypothetical protein